MATTAPPPPAAAPLVPSPLAASSLAGGTSPLPEQAQGTTAEAAAAAARLGEELADVECRRYSDPRGMAERAVGLLAQARHHGLVREAARARLVLADTAARTDDVDGAVEASRAILFQSRVRGEPMLAARAEAVLAWSLFRMGAISESVVHAVESVRALPADAPPHLRVDHTMILALLNGMQTTDGGYTDAFDHVLAEAERLDNPHLLLLTLNNYAYLHWSRGRSADALPLVARMEALSRDRGVPLTSTVMDTIASVLLAVGELARAEAVARAILEPGVPEAEARARPEALLTLAKVRDRRGDAREALALADRAAATATERSLPDVVASVTEYRAGLLAGVGDYRAAYEAMALAHATWKRVRDREAEDRASTLNALFETEQARERSLAFEQLAERDALTGMWNRRHIDRVLPRLLGDEQLATGPVCVAIIDVDHFKRLNDARSHVTGDSVLARIGELLGRAVPEPGFTARLGGEEFLVVMPGTGPTEALAACLQIRALVDEQRWSALTDGIAVTVSIGVTGVRLGGTVSTALRDADTALYRAKDGGRNRVELYEDPAPRA